MHTRFNLPGNHALPSDDSDLKQFVESKNREMQGNDDFQPLFRLIASTVERSQLRKELEPRDIQSTTRRTSGHTKQL